MTDQEKLLKQIHEKVNVLTLPIRRIGDDIWSVEDLELRRELWEQWTELRRAKCSLGVTLVLREFAEIYPSEV